jgi:hypothetical protein
METTSCSAVRIMTRYSGVRLKTTFEAKKGMTFSTAEAADDALNGAEVADVMAAGAGQTISIITFSDPPRKCRPNHRLQHCETMTWFRRA